MVARVRKCMICGQYFDSLKSLKAHKDKVHRITNKKMVTGTTGD